ncbi:hypothetical protein SDC9_187224 [bioreactor metagenome]|uniref:Uncharacterized protein n=1 Tax=bioreactor metagenome TaxID=1076179 RepID=A0A645HL01_9ZZZZ
MPNFPCGQGRARKHCFGDLHRSHGAGGLGWAIRIEQFDARKAAQQFFSGFDRQNLAAQKNDLQVWQKCSAKSRVRKA